MCFSLAKGRRLSNLAGSVIVCDEPRQLVRNSHAVAKEKIFTFQNNNNKR